jgi:hypothetical protein
MDWDGKTHFWLGLLLAPVYLVWKLLNLIAAPVRRFIVDVAKGVYKISIDHFSLVIFTGILLFITLLTSRFK